MSSLIKIGLYLLVVTFLFGYPSVSFAGFAGRSAQASARTLQGSAGPAEINGGVAKGIKTIADEEPAFAFLQSCPAAAQGSSGDLFINMITTLAAAQCALQTETIFPTSCTSDLKNDDIFDFIIVGAGSAGSVLAARLAENPKWKILLIESGDDPSIRTQIPGLFSMMVGSSEDWGYRYGKTDKACLGLNNGECLTPHGKVIGGTSTMDFLDYARGSPCEYDAWYKMGLTNWNWTCVLPYFIKAENTKFKLFQDRPDHGTHGPWTNDYIDSCHPIKECILSIVQEVGIGRADDEVPIGYYEALNAICNGNRVSVAEAYLGCSKKEHCAKNLFIAKKANVEKILISKKNSVAYGVKVRVHKESVITLKAKKEIIVAAGPINSAKLLMLSGIGPFDDLKKAGIETCVNADVGKNLIEQLTFMGFMYKIDKGAFKEQCSSAEALFKYYVSRDGPLSNVGILNLVGNINTIWNLQGDGKGHKSKSSSNDGCLAPDIKIVHYTYPCNDPDVILNAIGYYNMDENFMKTVLYANKESDLLVLAPSIVNPTSRGEIKLVATEGHKGHKVELIGNLLCEEEDVLVLLRAIRYLQDLMRHEFMAKYKPELLVLPVEACNAFDYDSDEYWICMIRHYTTPVMQTAGTVKMGMSGENCDVVNQDLEVRQVRDLRVVGSAVLPSMVSGSMRTVAVMMAEKLADIIKAKYGGAAKEHDEFILAGEELGRFNKM